MRSRPERWRWLCLGKHWWQIHTGFLNPALLARSSAPETLMSPPARVIRLRSGSGTTEVARLAVPELPDAPLILKRYHRGSLWQRLRDSFRKPRARRAFEMAFRLQQGGVPTALPVAAAGSRWPWKDAGFLITAEVRFGCRLYEFSRECEDARERLVFLAAYCRARRRPLDARQTAARIGVLPPFARHGVTVRSVHPDPRSAEWRGG